MADLRINGWSDEAWNVNPIWIKLLDTSGEESILVSDCSGGFETRLYIHSSFAIILFVFLVSRDGCVALPRGAMGLSSVCDCGIFWSYSLTIFDKTWSLIWIQTAQACI